jgi:hypothetical protein
MTQRRRWLRVCAAAPLLCAATAARAEEVPSPSPPPETEAWTADRYLTVAGAALFGGGYLPSMIAGLADMGSDDEPDDAALGPLLIPLAGPIVVGAREDVGAGAWVLLGGAALAQTTGFVLMAIGAALEVDPQSSVTATRDGLLVRW